VDSSQETFSSLDEVRQIQSRIRRSTSLEELRDTFERVKGLRRLYADDFDGLISLSDLQNEIIERARALREDRSGPRWPPELEDRPREEPRRRIINAPPLPPPPVAEIPPEVERLDAKNWQRAIYIGLFFAVILFAAFFYLVQTARRLNLTPAETPSAPVSASAEKPAAPKENANATPLAPLKPALRIYTDLLPGKVSVDEKEPQDLKDGELILENLEPGRHSIQVTGNGGNAAFSYEVTQNEAPHLVGSPTVSNVMAVLVSSNAGNGRLVTSAENADVSLDGNAVGQATADGVALTDLSKADHLLQVSEGKDRQRFVLTYNAAPTLTVYVKSDPNAGTAVIIAKQDGADVYINDKLYRRKTEAGQLRVPLKVGEYTIRVHKAGFIDPPPETIEVKKAEETAVNFRLDPAPQIATLEVKGAQSGTMIYIDKEFAATVGSDGNASISNVKPGEHTIELRRDQAVPKTFDRTFKTGDVVLLSGPDADLEKVVIEKSAEAPQPVPAATPAPASEAKDTGNLAMEGQQVRKGGGFVPYHVPKVAGRYSFAGQALKGGFLKHGKLQWYAGYQDAGNYVLFTVDGKHATVREVQDGASKEVARIPFDIDSNTWVQVDVAVKSNSLDVHIKTPDTPWQSLAHVSSPGRDFTQDKVGFYIPEKDEITVANFRFAAHQ
jgi:PEGA domain